jgi:hypothetical protein
MCAPFAGLVCSVGMTILEIACPERTVAPRHTPLTVAKARMIIERFLRIKFLDSGPLIQAESVLQLWEVRAVI